MLCAAHPKLARLREKMEAAGVEELIFDSATKVGKPLDSRAFPKTDEEWANYQLPTESMVDLNNENYRLQLNPNHQTVSEEGEIGKVSSPTQLTFFVNLLNHVDNITGREKVSIANKESADKIYKSFANLYSLGVEKMNRKLTSTGKIKKSAIQATLTGAGNERAAELLKEVGYNIPILKDKVLIQIMNLFSKTCLKPKFEGGKFTLQASYGIEMIKPDSIQYAALDDVQKSAHDAIWTDYGNKERKNQEGSARRLEYKTDESGRLYAEVLIDKAYAEQIGVGQFLLPDALAYRIPSTELHSSIALKVAGFYDSKGSNVIIAPAELVKHHGSDFDVDALYVINREHHKLNIGGQEINYPVGYNIDPATGLYKWDEGYIQDYMNTLSANFGDSRMGNTYKELHDTLYEKLNRNRIVENFLQIITNPDNRERMLEPIDTKPLKDVIEDLGLDPKTKLDLSDVLDNLKMFKSNFQGLRLTGIFANAVKGLAYMVKAGKSGGYPELKADKKCNPFGINLFGIDYNGFTEVLPNGDTIWKVLNTLIETSINNGQVQLLQKINASNQTGKLYAAGLSVGVPLLDLVTFHLNPITLAYTESKGNIHIVVKKLICRYMELSLSTLVSYDDLKQLAKDIIVTKDDAKKLFNRPIGSLDTDEILIQVKLLDSLYKLHSLGESLKKFSEGIIVVQNFPVKYDKIEVLIAKWESIGWLNENGEFEVNENFIYQIPNLFKSQPNIKQGYLAFNKAVEVVNNSLIRHLPAMRVMVESIIKSTKIKLSYKSNKENLKSEIISFMLSGMYAKENELEPTLHYTYRRLERQVAGKVAWSHRFAESLESIVENNKKLAKNVQNNFLNKLTISEKYGLKYISFESSSNDTYLDNLEMQEGFELLISSFGETIEERKANTETLKKNFVRYAVMNYGLKFGLKNYSNVIPANQLHEVDSYLCQMEGIIRNSFLKDGVVAGPFSKIEEVFLLRLAVNNPENLAYISPKKIEPTKNPNGRTIYISSENTGRLKSLPDLKGLENGYYYNRRFENPIENGKLKYDEMDFPLLIRTSDDVIMIRLNDAKSSVVYYQKLGTKNWMGGYEMSSTLYSKSYSLSKFFKPFMTPVAVANNKDNHFTTNNRDLSLGDRVIVHNFNDESRQNGIIGIIDEIRFIQSFVPTVIFKISKQNIDH